MATEVATPNNGQSAQSSQTQQQSQQTPQQAQAAANFASASLYVGDLNQDVAEANLFEIFNAIAPVASIRVCRDAITRRSLGYAYVNFNNHNDAEKALDALDNTPIKGKPCRIMWSQRDPAMRRSNKNNIFIKNLAKDIDRKALCDTFSQFGNILSCKIELDDKGDSKGYGFIQFENQEAAELATQKLDGKMLNGKKVYVGPFVPRKERLAAVGEAQFTNVFVKNLADEFMDDELMKLFSSYGRIKSAIVMKDDAGRSKGFGFVDFEDPDDAAEAVKELNDSEVAGKQLFVGRAQKKHERESELRNKFESMKIEQLTKYQGANLYVKNLEEDVTDQGLRELFAPYGEITSAVVKRDFKTNASKGFGFVCYSTPEEATKAVQELHGKIVGSKPLYVSLHQPKEQRRAHLENQFAQRGKMPGGPGGRGMPPMPMYANTSMFYGPSGNTGFVYPGPMGMPANPRGRGYPPGAFVGAMPGQYVMVPGRGGVKGGGRGVGVMRRKGQAGEGGQNAHPNQAAQQQQSQPPQTSIEILASALANYPLEEKKTILGEKLYPLILKSQPQLAGKITGMILESCTVEEILHMLDKNDTLEAKIDEAISALREHESK